MSGHAICARARTVHFIGQQRRLQRHMRPAQTSTKAAHVQHRRAQWLRGQPMQRDPRAVQSGASWRCRQLWQSPTLDLARKVAASPRRAGSSATTRLPQLRSSNLSATAAPTRGPASSSTMRDKALPLCDLCSGARAQCGEAPRGAAACRCGGAAGTAGQQHACCKQPRSGCWMRGGPGRIL
jgi:hypothetical protein